MTIRKARKKFVQRVWLKKIRDDEDLSQAKAAALCDVTQTHFCDIENGKKTPSPRTAKVIGERLCFDWTRFFDEEAN